MGQLVNMGLLNRSEVTRVLLDAARGWSGIEREREILATIASGLNSKAAEDTR